MAKKGLFGKLGNIMGVNSDEIDDNVEIEETEPTNHVVENDKVVKFSTLKEKRESKMEGKPLTQYTFEHIILEPKFFEDVIRIADEIRLCKKLVTINISKLSTEDARRVLDFISGLTYGLESKFTRSGKDVFEVVPFAVKQINETEQEHINDSSVDINSVIRPFDE